MKVLVVGLGSMGKRRIRLMKSMKVNVDIYGVDSNCERCKDVTLTYSVPTFNSIDEAYAKSGDDIPFECAFICTSPIGHADLIEEMLLRNCNVFTEINLISDKYESNIRIAEERGLTLFLSSTPIYQDEMITIADIMRQCSQNVAYNYHVGQYLPDWHPWEDYTNFFVNNKRTNGCREIMAIELPWMTKAFGPIEDVIVTKRKITNLNIDYDDIYMLQIIHKNGNIGQFTLDLVCRKDIRRLEIYNEDIFIQWDGTPDTLKMYNLEKKELVCIGHSDYYREPEYSEYINECAYINEIYEFFAVINGKKSEYTMLDDLQILSIIDKIECK